MNPNTVMNQTELFCVSIQVILPMNGFVASIQSPLQIAVSYSLSTINYSTFGDFTRPSLRKTYEQKLPAIAVGVIDCASCLRSVLQLVLLLPRCWS